LSRSGRAARHGDSVFIAEVTVFDCDGAENRRTTDSSLLWFDSAGLDARKEQNRRLGCSRNDLGVKWNYSKTVL
jgi:hypothetical protein